ncbi:MAG: 2-polyprenylphenol 6-hydroxylase [Hyphomicrobiales bacterium]|nr:2-polyprenylphenol 6-hydroxylase [Hyphomicrobiales bacterium]
MLTAPIHLIRLARVGFVLAREGAFGLVDEAAIPAGLRLGVRFARLVERRGGDPGAGLAQAMTRLGPSYVKFGQFLATRPDIVGVRVASGLEALQDRMAPFPRAQAITMVEAALDKSVSTTFSEFGEPVAAASIAQVHKARLAEQGPGRLVAVKVLRPGIEPRFKRDLADMRFGARLIERVAPAMRRLRLAAVVETLARSVAIEMDLRLEAAALSEFAENTKDDPDFRVPSVDWEHTAKEVLTLEWIDGLPLSQIAEIEAAGHDRVALARIVIQSFLRQALGSGFFHADMHQGNLFVDARGRLVAVDFGIMGRLGEKERRFLAEILYGFITRDYRRVAEVHFEAGYVPHTHAIGDFAQALRAIGEPIQQRRADQISMAKLLSLLFEVTALFDMETRTELVMLQKTMVVVEGVGRMLDPKLDMWTTADPVVREWITRHLGPAGRLEQAVGALQGFVSAAGKLPDLVTRAERVLARLDPPELPGEFGATGMRIDEASIEAIGRAEARGSKLWWIALWVIAALLAIHFFL